MSCPRLHDAAPYALGTLDAADRAEFAAHLPGCPECRAALGSVAALPALLARVPRDAVEPGPPPSPVVAGERLFERVLQGALAERRGRRRRWLAAAAAAAVVAIGGGGAGWYAATQPGVQPPSVVAGSSGAVSAQVWLRPVDGGTALRVRLTGVTGEQRCRLVAVDVAGQQETAATWESAYTGPVSAQGTTRIPADRLARLRIETDAGTLVDLQVPRS